MSSSDKWLPLYVADYLGDTMHLTTLQHGAYMLLLMHYWRTGPLPTDPEELAAITKVEVKVWPTVWAKLSGFFTTNGDGTLHQKRMDWELRRWGEISEKRREAGKRGAEAKHHRPHPTVVPVAEMPPQLPGKQLGKTLANAKNPSVDNLANASDLPDHLPPSLPENSGNCQDFATPFASVHSPSQRKNISSLIDSVPPRESEMPSSEQKSSPDRMNDWLDSLDQADEAHKASLMSTERNHAPDVQKAAVRKPRSIACPLTGDHLAMVRKHAGMVAAT